MEFPDAETAEAALPAIEFPTFHEVRYDPPAPVLDDPAETARRELDSLGLDDLDREARVAVGLGSRGITDIVPVARAVIEELQSRNFDPVVVPAMGSHGGATADGQERTLASIDLTEEALGCPIDPRMDTTHLGTSAIGGEVHHSTAALDADGVLVVNRVKAHTNYDGRFESGLTKMVTVGLGKQIGAKAVHEQALVKGYEAAIESAFEIVTAHSPVLGGIAIIENFHDETAMIEGVPASALPDRETVLLERAYEYMPTLPYDALDVLVVDRIGKDISGAGMDTNVIGRYEVLNTDDPQFPDIDRIVVRGLTEATHGNGQGLGLADITTTDVAEAMDLDQVYTNALTSGSLSKARMPVALPTDRLALATALTTIGPYDPERVRVAWIRDTSHLSSFKVSTALADDEREDVEIGNSAPLSWDDGAARFE